VIAIHPALGFGKCTLNVIVPEAWTEIECVSDLRKLQGSLNRPLRAATKFPQATAAFLSQHGLSEVEYIQAEGTLESHRTSVTGPDQ
jgi:ATP phosphoribosyltransferase